MVSEGIRPGTWVVVSAATALEGAVVDAALPGDGGDEVLVLVAVTPDMVRVVDQDVGCSERGNRDESGGEGSVG